MRRSPARRPSTAAAPPTSCGKSKPATGGSWDAHGGELPADLTTIVDKACDPDPGRRYGTADELAFDLRAFRAGEPIRARPPSLTYVLGKRIRRHSLSMALGAVLVIAILGLGCLGRDRPVVCVSRPVRAGAARAGCAARGRGPFLARTCRPRCRPTARCKSIRSTASVRRLPWTEVWASGTMEDGTRGRVTVSAGQRLEVAGAVQVGCTADGRAGYRGWGAPVDCARAGLGWDGRHHGAGEGSRQQRRVDHGWHLPCWRERSRLPRCRVAVACRCEPHRSRHRRPWCSLRRGAGCQCQDREVGRGQTHRRAARSSRRSQYTNGQPPGGSSG